MLSDPITNIINVKYLINKVFLFQLKLNKVKNVLPTMLYTMGSVVEDETV